MKSKTIKRSPQTNSPVFLGLSKGEIVLILVAVGIRLAYVIYMSNTSPFFKVPLLDTKWHHLWASEIALGELAGRTAFFRAPLYPYFLGLIYALFGVGQWAPVIIQSMMGGISCYVLYRIVSRIWSGVIGRWSGYAMALCPTLIYFGGELLIVTLLVFLFLVALWSWLVVLERLSAFRWVLTGVLFGLAGIARPTVLLSVVFLVVWYLWKYRSRFSRSVVQMGMVVLGCVVPIIPVTVHNAVVSRDFVLISWQGGVNFYIGNNPESDGCTARAPGEQVRRTGGYQDNVWVSSVMNAELEMGRSLTPSEVSNFWFVKGLRSWVDYPGTLLVLTLKKAALLLGAYDIESNLAVSYRIKHNPILTGLPVRWGLIVPFALLGMVISRGIKGKEWLLLALAGQALIIVAFFVTARYRQPMIPLLIPFGVAGVSYIWGRRRVPGKLILPVAAVIAVGVAIHMDYWGLGAGEEDRIHFAQGLAFSRLGEVSKAIAEYDLAVAVDSTNKEARFNRAQLLLERGDFDKSEAGFRSLVSSYPGYAPGWNGLGVLFRQRMQRDSARAAWERTLDIDPYYLDPLLNLGAEAQEVTEWDRSLEYLERAVAVAPESDIVRLKYGVGLAATGSVVKAIQEFEVILRRNPSHAAARRNLEICRKSLQSGGKKSAKNP